MVVRCLFTKWGINSFGSFRENEFYGWTDNGRRAPCDDSGSTAQ